MDDITAPLALADQMLWTTALVAAPILLASLAVGLVVGVIQAATSVNEQTLTFVPKLVGVFVVLMLAGPWILKSIEEFMREVFNFSFYVG